MRDLPLSIEVDGKHYSINSDFRRILDIIDMYNDETMTVYDKHLCMLGMLYTYFDENGEEVENIPENIEEAINKGALFIDRNETRIANETARPRIIDYNKDAKFIFAAINKNKEQDIRISNYVHWFTFVDALFTFDESDIITHIIQVRNKKANGVTLDEHEKKFYNNNKDIIDMDYFPTDKRDREDFHKLLQQRAEEFYEKEFDGSDHEDVFVKVGDENMELSSVFEELEKIKRKRQ